MTREIDYTEFIDRYLQDEMSPEEKVWFEKELDGNTALVEEIDFQQKVNVALSDKDTLQFKMQLDQIHEEIHVATENGKRLIHSVYKNISIAASALAVFMIVFSVYFSNRTFSSERLFDQFYQPAEASVIYRTADNSSDLLVTAINYYDQQDYAKAIVLFESILQEDGFKPGVNLYSGISYMELNNYEEANNNFQKIINNSPNPFVESASWYLGVSYVLTSEREKAQKLFSALANGNGFYKKDAKKVLRHL
jgi:tetratricopeptide (TPR) repeat protein